ncbi:hypothetical protein LTR22_027703 [Elasticomyces elasticus]|nr:hypothetical protein LTR22_027703 [Elasticomyces elasticus]
MNDPAVSSLVHCIRSSERILAIVGAGLSHPSGLPTFQGDGAYFRGHPSRELACKSAFDNDPSLVWTFYESRRQMALKAVPNSAHLALVDLAKHKPQLLIVTQNIDGLSERAGQADANLVPIHGSVFASRCADDGCAYATQNYSNESTVPGLAKLLHDTSSGSPQAEEINIPTCPLCQSAILRPAVVWYGEKLSSGALKSIDDWLDASSTVDLVLVIGTTRTPFLDDALIRGAAVASFNFFNDWHSAEHVFSYDDDEWHVNGDVSRTLPDLIREVSLHM